MIQAWRDDALPEVVRPKNPAGHGAIGGGMSGHGQVVGPSARSIADGAQGVLGDREKASFDLFEKQCPVGGGDRSRFHIGKDTTCRKSVNTCNGIHFVERDKNSRVATGPWTKRALFCEWVEEAQSLLADNIPSSRKMVASAMGIAYNSLRKYCNPNEQTHRPGETAMQRLGNLLGRDWRQLLDEPEAAPDGISPTLWEAADQDAKTWANIMVHESVHLTPKQRKMLLDMVREFRQ